MLQTIEEDKEGTPEGESDSGSQAYPDDLSIYSKEILTSSSQMPFEEISKRVIRRQKVNVPVHLQKSRCFHCGERRPKNSREPQCGAFDPTERKWYCYLCWRQFRHDIFDLAVPNKKGEECCACSIYVLENQGRYMDLGEKPGIEKGLYCSHCWAGWVNSLPADEDWLHQENIDPDVEAKMARGNISSAGELERIQRSINEAATKVEVALDLGVPPEELETKMSEIELLMKKKEACELSTKEKAALENHDEKKEEEEDDFHVNTVE